MLGALKPLIDTRDYKVCGSRSTYPEEFVCGYPKVKNQSNVQSCVAHALSSILEWFNQEETGEETALSTNFIYGMQGIKFDKTTPGMYLREACKIALDCGDAPLNLVPGNSEQPSATRQLQDLLTPEIEERAKFYKVKSYARCRTKQDMQYALTTSGPLLASVKWYDRYSFGSCDEKKDYTVTYDTNSSFDYHAIVILGWNAQGWICQNSWGADWGDEGRFILPFDNKFVEVWSFVDENNTKKPVSWLNVIYKLINKIVNKILGNSR